MAYAMSFLCVYKQSQKYLESAYINKLYVRKGGLHKVDDFKVIDNYLMIRLPDEIDHHKSVDISSKADRYILSGKVGNVVFDFERTTFMDSSGIGIILGRYKKISCFGGKVYAVNTDNRIRKILLMSGLENIVEIMDQGKECGRRND